MLNARIIGPDDALDLFDMPDVEAAIKARIATKRHARRLVDHAITKGPTVHLLGPMDDLPEVMRYGTQRVAQSKMDGAHDDELGDVRDLMATASTYMQQAEAAAAPPAPDPAAAPPMPGPEAGPMPGAMPAL